MSLALGLLIAVVAAGCHSGGEGGSDGAPTFSKSFGGTAVDLAADAAATPDDGYVMVGTLNGRTLDGVLVDQDLWVTKLDAFGDPVWSQVVSENQTSVGNSDEVRLVHIVVPREVDGGFFLVGRVTGLADVEVYDELPADLAVTLLDDDGNTVWETDIALPELPFYTMANPELPPSERPTSAVATGDGGLLVAGVAEGVLNVEGHGAEAEAPWVMKIDAGGDVVWQAFDEQDLYTVVAYLNADVLVRETFDGGAVLATSEVLRVVTGLGLKKNQEATRVTRFDADGQLLWSELYAGILVHDLRVYERAGADPSESYLLAGWDFDEASDDEWPIYVLDHQGQEVHHRSDVDGFASVFGMAHVVDPTTGEDFIASVGPSFELSPDPHLRIVVFDGELEALTSIDLPEAHAMLDFRGFVDGGTAGFELFASSLDDPEALAGELSHVRVSTAGAALGNTSHGVEVPTIVEWNRREGLQIAGWIPHSTDFWIWDLLDARDPSVGARLARHDSGGTEVWGRTFAPATDRRLERALQVEVIPKEDNAGLYEIAVIAQVAFDPNNDLPSPSEPLSTWYLRFGADGELLTQRVLEEFVVESGEFFLDPATGATTPTLRSSAHCLELAENGDLFVGGRADGRARVVRLSPEGEVVWCTSALAGTFDGSVRSIAATADGGVLALNDKWVAIVDQDGEIEWQRWFRAGGLAGICELVDGEYLLAASKEGAVLVLALDALGNELWEFALDEGELANYDVVASVVSTLDGGAALLLGRLGQDASPITEIVESDSWDLELVRLARDGTVLWRQIYGALLEEAVGDLALTPDGGFLVSARSDSLGEHSEAWLLRTDSEGRIIEGCAAALARLEPGTTGTPSDVYDSFSIGASDGPPADLVLFTTDARQEPVTDQLVVARQCSGTSADTVPGGADAPDQDDETPDGDGEVPGSDGPFDLRIDIAGTNVGRVYADPPNESCDDDCEFVGIASSGEIVTLIAIEVVPGSFLGWSGVDSSAGTTAQVHFDGADREVTATFE